MLGKQMRRLWLARFVYWGEYDGGEELRLKRKKEGNKMKDVTRRISLDFTRKSNTRVIFASEADFNSREFIISLFEDGVPYQLDGSGFATVNVCRADGERAGYIADVTDDGCVRYVAGLWAFEVPGEVKISVSIFDGDKKRLTSSYFTVCVEEGLYIGGDIAESDDAHTFLGDLMGIMGQFKNQENQRQSKENERIANEEGRTQSDLARDEAELRRANAEKYRESAEGSTYSGSPYYGGRQLQELLREENELARQRAEAERVANENQRIEITATLKSSLESLIELQRGYIERGKANE